MKIGLNIGHFGTVGATGYLDEASCNIEMYNALKPLLIKAGHTVFDCSSKVKPDYKSSTVLANTHDLDLLISLHLNSSDKPSANGTEVLYYPSNETGQAYAEKISAMISSDLQTKNRGAKPEDEVYIISQTKATCVLIESLFVSNKEDSQKYDPKKIALAIAKVFGYEEGVENVARTVMELPSEVFVQEISPSDFKIEIVDKTKKNIDQKNYFNLGFFSGKGPTKPTVPVGNLAIDGKIITQSKDNEGWINVAKKKLTTIYTTNDGKCGITQTDSLENIKNLKNAVSGIPIILNARQVKDSAVEAEGYSGGETRDEWHGFLGIRHNKLVYVAMKCGFNRMCWAMVALGIYDAIKLDGGGSFVLKNGEIIKATSENRRIHNIGVWSK